MLFRHWMMLVHLVISLFRVVAVVSCCFCSISCSCCLMLLLLFSSTTLFLTTSPILRIFFCVLLKWACVGFCCFWSSHVRVCMCVFSPSCLGYPIFVRASETLSHWPFWHHVGDTCAARNSKQTTSTNKQEKQSTNDSNLQLT